jgi:hypothetical protein
MDIVSKAKRQYEKTTSYYKNKIVKEANRVFSANPDRIVIIRLNGNEVHGTIYYEDIAIDFSRVLCMFFYETSFYYNGVKVYGLEDLYDLIKKHGYTKSNKM